METVIDCWRGLSSSLLHSCPKKSSCGDWNFTLNGWGYYDVGKKKKAPGVTVFLALTYIFSPLSKNYDVGKKKKAPCNSLHNTRTSRKELKIILWRLLSNWKNISAKGILPHECNGDLKLDLSNSRNIWNLDFLKVGFQMVQYLNGTAMAIYGYHFLQFGTLDSALEPTAYVQVGSE